MSILLSIFLGGGVGALLRFLISEQTDRLFLSSFPFGTIVVNVLGAFLMGLVVSYFADKVNICLLYTSPSPRDRVRSRMPSSA